MRICYHEDLLKIIAKLLALRFVQARILHELSGLHTGKWGSFKIFQLKELTCVGILGLNYNYLQITLRVTKGTWCEYMCTSI